MYLFLMQIQQTVKDIGDVSVTIHLYAGLSNQ